MHTPRSHKLRLPGHGHGDKPQPHANVHGDGPRARGKSAGMVLLLLLALAQLMVILDISAVNVALPDLAKDLDIGGGDLGWTITSYSLVFGSLAAARRTRRGPARSPPRLPHRPRGLHRRLARLGAGDKRRGLLRRPRRTGSRCGDAVPGRAVDHHDHLPGPRPREGARRLGRRRRRRRRHRRPAGRDAHRARRLASHLPHQPARRHRRRRRGDEGRARRRRSAPVARPRPPRRRGRHREPRRRSSTPSRKPPMPAGRRRRRSASASPAWLASPRSPPWSCTPASPCSTSRGSASAESAAAS